MRWLFLRIFFLSSWWKNQTKIFSFLLWNSWIILKILPVTRFKDPNAAILTLKIHTELEFLKSLWGLGTEEEEGYRTGPPGYIGWRNSFPGIDSGAPYTFKNTGSWSCLWYCKIILEAACDKLILAHFLCSNERSAEALENIDQSQRREF